MEAIDKNKDGTLSTEELKNAAKALATLDKNKDGKIDQEEMRPQFNRGQGGREEFSRPGQGGQGGREGFSRPGQGSQGGREQGGRSNPFDALGVNEAQQKKLDSVRQELSTQMRALFTDRDTPREERSAKMAKIREGFDAKIKEILTKEQYKKFEETRSARGGRGEGQGRRPGQGGREGFRRPGQEGGQGRPEAPRGREGQPSRPGRSES
jgi:Spy/CpxP family protein refolding chaperone